MPEYRLAIDPSGRAGCKGSCKQKIPKGAVRFGSDREAEHGVVTSWRRLPCMTKKVCQNATAACGTVDAIIGFAELGAAE